MTKAAAVLWAALTVLTAAACSVTHTSATPSVTSTSTSNSAGASASVTATISPSASGAFEPETVFGPAKDVLWRDHPGPGQGPFAFSDSSVHPGSYRLDVACRGGAIAVNGTGIADAVVTCSKGTVIIPVCLIKQGLDLTATWTVGSDGDVVWQLRRRTGSTCK